MSETVLITGASGLLGRALVAKFSDEGFQVLAQYHQHPFPDSASVQWLAGDFSTPRGVEDFLHRQRKKLVACRYLVNNFGPIHERPTAVVSGRDLSADFELQVVPALDITQPGRCEGFTQGSPAGRPEPGGRAHFPDHEGEAFRDSLSLRRE
ncbi:MAG: NAD-dependent epimerase/dehydratase family protein [Candidatus Aminicenantes bacterium]|nr:NAD-dependent epimerase/dehydratase family protein [Candidatus Aminicenantes bacterium]